MSKLVVFGVWVIGVSCGLVYLDGVELMIILDWLVYEVVGFDVLVVIFFGIVEIELFIDDVVFVVLMFGIIIVNVGCGIVIDELVLVGVFDFG